MAKIGDVIDGKYQILSLIGEGGMSRVWLARDMRLLKTWRSRKSVVRRRTRTTRSSSKA